MGKKTTVRARRSKATLSAPIPPEICAIICEMVADRRGLLILCRMSSTFRAQAQRLLYHSIDLSEKPMRKLNSWAAAVSKHAYLGEFVHSLVLRLPDMVSFEASTANKLGRALSKCVNLKELRILSEGRGSVVGSRHNSFNAWMLNKCSFRLWRFENQYFDDTVLKEFWRKQTELRVLSTGNDVYSLDPDLEILPQLIAVNSDFMFNLPGERPLQRIETMAHNDLTHLQKFEATLTTLNLTRAHPDKTFPIGAVIKLVAESLPNLVHFGYIEEDRCWDVRVSSIFLALLATHVLQRSYHPHGVTSKAVLQKFTKLQTLLLQLQDTWRFVVEGASDAEHYLTTPTDVCDLGRDIMAVCPTLRRTAIHIKLFGMGVSVLTRSQPGETIHEDPGPWHRCETFSMFWDPATVPLPVHDV
ncbi:hypothetical protein R3P38DRAFT_3251570 [Favolaschia claudopus]|uniref:F-box domain-containing protein n=1 Tax=Favolaschia claudopus TaxID=2862362 RepID=A0AAW0ED17_9AGAR